MISCSFSTIPLHILKEDQFKKGYQIEDVQLDVYSILRCAELKKSHNIHFRYNTQVGQLRGSNSSWPIFKLTPSYVSVEGHIAHIEDEKPLFGILLSSVKISSSRPSGWPSSTGILAVNVNSLFLLRSNRSLEDPDCEKDSWIYLLFCISSYATSSLLFCVGLPRAK